MKFCIEFQFESLQKSKTQKNLHPLSKALICVYQIRWKEQVLDEFFVEKMFFEKGNSNKEDRSLHAKHGRGTLDRSAKNALDKAS